MKEYYLNYILTEANLYTAFYQALRQKYAISLKKVYETLKKEGKFCKGHPLNFDDLKKIQVALIETLRLKHKNKIKKLKKDNTNLMKVYFILFHFTSRERIYHV